MEKLVLIDGNSLLNRAFYATPVFTTKNGLPTNAVFGFVKLMLKIITDKKPSYFAVAFDLHAPTFRHKIYDGYKAGRKPMPEELVVQVPVLKEVLKIMKIKTLELEGYEADDLLGTVAKKFNVQTYIYTGDRDAYQLVDATTSVCFTKKGVSDLLELNDKNFFDEIGLTPSQIIDLKALMGDKSDNIPGVAGVGEKSANGLLTQYFDLDGVYNHLDSIHGALHTKLENGKELAYFSKKLATIDTNAPIDVTIGDCLLTMPFPHALREKFAELEFKSLVGLKIFADEQPEETQNKQLPKEKKFVEPTEVYPSSVEEALRVLQDSKADILACDITDYEFRFVAIEGSVYETKEVFEYVLPLKLNLLDAGFFDYELAFVFKKIFEGSRKVLLYNAKEVMRRLFELDITMSAPFDDVAILKCLADGLSNSDGLTFCLNQNGIPDKYRAYGLLRLFDLYFGQLNEEEKKLYQTVELPLVRVLFDMENQGVCVDLDTLNALSKRYTLELSSITKTIYQLAGEEFNINSTQQLGKILFEKLRIGRGVKKSKESKNYKTTAEELEKYADESEIVRQILRYRKVQKINSTYIEGFKPLIKNGKVHTTYNQYNTATGRLSSMNPNLQNIPIRTEEGRELRKLFTASEGCVLIDADYSQIELRLLAHFSGCKELISAYCAGEDIHALTASQVFNVPLSEVTPQLRREAKAVNFGIIYGISAFGLGNDLNISAKRAKEYIDKYFERYSEVKAYMNGNVETAVQNGFVKTLLGRRRVINEIRSTNHNVRSFGERAAMNMPLQGSSADIIKIAMINVHSRLKENGYKARLVLQVHDELVIDAPKEEAEEVSALLQEEMENAVKLNVPLTVEVGVGANWYESK
ncbi:MAG: DNA polymerase I [Clostridia bacterium]|nr:DNA polymerase I [Clostridia bacterium]